MKNFINFIILVFAMLSVLLFSCEVEKEVDITLPVVRTLIPEIIASTMATVGCIVDSTGNSEITECGVYWGTSEDPETTGIKLELEIDTGCVLGQIKGLLPGTRYFIKAYAINIKGEGLGDQVEITTMGTVKDYDNNVYEIAKIGSQYWMAENLRTIHYSDGTPITLVNSRTSWGNLNYTAKAYCWYDDDISNAEPYGAYYTWAAVMNGSGASSANPSGVQGACPTGWHVPGDAEWTELTDYLGGEIVAGSKMKTTGTIEGGDGLWLDPNSGATNISCFSAVSTGLRNSDGDFVLFGSGAHWWTSSEDLSAMVFAINVFNTNPDVQMINFAKEWTFIGQSVRCVKD